jgi:hypothetical protein
MFLFHKNCSVIELTVLIIYIYSLYWWISSLNVQIDYNHTFGDMSRYIYFSSKHILCLRYVEKKNLILFFVLHLQALQQKL